MNILQWLLKGDPSIRYQTFRDLMDSETNALQLEIVRKKQRPEGTWVLQNKHPGRTYFEFEQSGKPSRWNTLRALRVLRWFDR